MPTTRKVIIVGSGPAGYTAAIYAARANLAPLLFTRRPGRRPADDHDRGGELSRLCRGDHGPELMETMRGQAARFGTEMVAEDVTRRRLGAAAVRGQRGAQRYEATTVIIATGASAKLLGLPGGAAAHGPRRLHLRHVRRLLLQGPGHHGRGGRRLGHGGGALPGAPWPQGGRRPPARQRCAPPRSCRNAPATIRRSTFVWKRAVEDILDPARARSRRCACATCVTGESAERAVDGLFVAIGHEPNTGIFRGQIDLVPNGYVRVVPGHDADEGARRVRRR